MIIPSWVIATLLMNIHKAKQKTWLKHAYLHRSIDVKFIFDSARLGLFSSANILQIAYITLQVVFLLFLPFF